MTGVTPGGHLSQMDDLRPRADARLDSALERSPFRDPRPFYRQVLKQLRARDRDALDRAVRHYEDELIPAVAADGDPLALWLDYGRLLARLAGPGRTLEVDASGRASPVEDDARRDPGAGSLLLHLPDDAAAPAVVLRCPRDATPAQDASIDLLVLGRQTASAQP